VGALGPFFCIGGGRAAQQASKQASKPPIQQNIKLNSFFVFCLSEWVAFLFVEDFMFSIGCIAYVCFLFNLGWWLILL
jgi:hypothetical protein